MVPIPPVEIPTPQEFSLTEHEIQETLNGTEGFLLDQMEKLTQTIRGETSEKVSVPLTSSSIDGADAVKIRKYVMNDIHQKKE
jgi:hypothetical protein